VAVKDVARLRTRLTAMTLDERRAIAGLDPRRADVAPAGIVLLDTLIDRLGARELTLCDFALREGLILDYLERNRAHVQTIARDPDIRRRSVLELAERCRYVAPHAQQVARLARAVFDGTRDRHKLGAREREWLEYGALLHDVGSHIGYERHHKHSAYLIRHGGLRGFTPEEVEVIALIARYHRRTTPRRSHEEFARLSRTDRRTVRLLSAMVRLAEGLDRSHAQVITRLRLRVARGALTIRAAASGDAELEQWAADRHATALADLLALPIRIVIATPSRRSPGKDLTRHARHARRAARVSRPSVRR
jgi:exopolyphosphatase/guanosine-5'-triphosphate,3'-diphosphate pyrophosphatase